MPTINASKHGYMVNAADGSGAFTTARNASSANGSVFNQPSSGNANIVAANLGFSSKGDSAILRRAWWAFDVSSYASGFTITDLQIQFDPSTITSTNFPVQIVKSTAQGNADENLSQADWDAFDRTTLYGGGSTTYWPDSNSVSTIDLNSTAIAAFSTSYLKLCIQWYFDYTGTGSLVNFNGQASINTSYTPRITFSAAASGYGNAVNNVPAESLSKVNNVATADIDKVINVT